MQKTILISILVGVIMAGAGFIGGMKYQQTKIPSGLRQFTSGQTNGAGNARGQGTGAQANFRPVAGEIIASDDSSITVKMTDGSSKIVILSDTTTINKSTEASKADLMIGESVSVIGQTNSDGSVTAQSIQIGQLVFGMRGTFITTPTP